MFEEIAGSDLQVMHELICEGFAGSGVLIRTEHDLQFEEEAEVANFVEMNARLTDDGDLTFCLDDAADAERACQCFFTGGRTVNWSEQVIG